MNVADDLWFDPQAGPALAEPSDEATIWTCRTGGPGQVCTLRAAVRIAGADRDAYQGRTDCDVLSSVRHEPNRAAAGPHLDGFPRGLTSRGPVEADRFLIGAQAGIKVLHGTGGLPTTSFTVDVA